MSETDEMVDTEVEEKPKPNRQVHVHAAVQTVVHNWSGLIGWFSFYAALAWTLHSPLPLAIGGAGIVAVIGGSAYARSVEQTAEYAAAIENREVVKLAFENAVRAHYVADGHPMAIIQMLGEAAMAGVSQQELQAIVNRVHESAHPDCFKPDEGDGESDDESPSG